MHEARAWPRGPEVELTIGTIVRRADGQAAMSIIISKHGKNARRLQRTSIQQEEYLQAYIHNNPDVLPLDELKDNLRLLILAREFNTASGPIDALGVDADGEIYIIEAKLDKNADRRRVIAQALDYGAALWASPEILMQQLSGSEWRTRLTEFLGGDEAVTAKHLAAVQQNAAAGRFWFVVLMDRLDDRLRDLISFVNANSRFKILGVELNLYQDGDLEILIPTLYGAEIAKEAATDLKTSGSPRVQGSRESFLSGASKLAEDSAEKLKELLDWSTEYGRVVFHPTSFGMVVESISAKPIFWVYQTDGKIELNFKGLGEAGQKPFVEKFGEMLAEHGFDSQGNIASMKYPRIPISLWGPREQEFKECLKRLIAEQGLSVSA